jgi:PhzF family phenazine biosynthesis protein
VVLDATAMTEERMQDIAREVGYSETAFVTAWDPALRRAEIRFFSPEAEVPFCGHATVATSVALAEEVGVGELVFITRAGQVRIETSHLADGVRAAFTSVDPWVDDMKDVVLAELLGQLGLDPSDLHPVLRPRLAFAGNVHPVLVLADRDVFDTFTFDPARLRALMDREGWTGTVTVLWQESPDVLHARNLFPVGSITEDPATGSAAASTGAYLRHVGAVRPLATVTIHQGEHVGRPSRLIADIPSTGGITVTGSAVRI